MPLPPRSEIAERMVISGLIKEYEWLKPKVKLDASDFYFDHHRRVLAAMVPPVTVERVWRCVPDAFGGWRPAALWLAEVFLLDPTGCSAEYNAAIVKRLSVRRQIIRRASEWIRDAYSIAMSPQEYEERLARMT